MYSFSQVSQDRLNTCHRDLQLIFEFALSVSEVDFGIAAGHRTPEEQYALYKQGRTSPGNIVTNIDGISDKSKHNYLPSMAVDVYAWVGGDISWRKKDLTYIGGVVIATAKLLKSRGIIEHDIRWGGNWDRDGEIITDQKLIDLPHFELI